MAAPRPVLQFQALSSEVDVGFWRSLSRLQLEEWGLDQRPRAVQGSLAAGRGALSLGAFSLPGGPPAPPRGATLRGTLRNFARVEDFKAADKAALLREEAAALAEALPAGGHEALGRFLLLTFVDLKRHVHLYWFAFPALAASPALREPPRAAPPAPPSAPAALRRMLRAAEAPPAPYFVAARGGGGGGEEALEARPLAEYEALREAGREPLLAFVDPGTLPANPGWTLRNLLHLAAARGWGPRVRVLALRDAWGAAAADAADDDAPPRSLVFEVDLPPPGADEGPPPAPRAVGWEKNARGRPGPRKVNLKALMDPAALAASSVDLNLKLMRWRVMPQLDLDTVRGTRCLLLGAGTLGCNVARTLLGWGVRHVTLVDNGRVSYSNPVRQNLFTFADCSGAPDGAGRHKAPAAAEALRGVFPGVTAEGHVLTIPMPGHAVTEAQREAVRGEFDRLHELVRSHDAVFLLTDSRESRWLPALLCAAYHKPCLNTAMGFDTFVVMRHGDTWDGAMPGEPEVEAPPARDGDGGDGAEAPLGGGGTPLGCYFCSDVVAPTDSLTARTLDQQCTVTRPGLAPMCSAMAVELLVSLLHHPARQRAPADGASPLGALPHQLRGYLDRFGVLPVVGQQSRHCTACSPAVLEAFRAGGFDFVLGAINNPEALEDVSGLRDLKAAADAALADWEDGSGDDGDDF